MLRLLESLGFKPIKHFNSSERLVGCHASTPHVCCQDFWLSASLTSSDTSLSTDFPLSNRPVLVFANEKHEGQMHIPQFDMIEDILSSNLKCLMPSPAYALLILDTIPNTVLRRDIPSLSRVTLWSLHILS